METKLCTKCDQIKLFSAFTKHNATKDGLQTWCKDCKNAIRRHQRQNKIGSYATEREKYHDSHLLTCRKLYHKNKQLVFDHYCPDGAKCKHCGFSDIRALSIDHINGGGAKHTKELKGINLCKWVVKNNFPSDFQILCMNCQFIKRWDQNGYSNPYDVVS